MEDELRKQYAQVCFSLNLKEQELEGIKTDLFTLNPHIKELVEEIAQLTEEKTKLEDQLND